MELILVLSILGVTNIDRNSAWWETDKRWNLYEYNLRHKLKKDESSKVLGNTSVNIVGGSHYRQSLPYLAIFTSSRYQDVPSSVFLLSPGCFPSSPTPLLIVGSSSLSLSSQPTSSCALKYRIGDTEAEAGKTRNSQYWIPARLVLGSLQDAKQ